MDRWNGKVAIVTGACGGIGAGITEALLDQGLIVVGLDMRLDRLEELSKKLVGKKGKFHFVKTDVTKEEDILKAFEWTSRNVGPVNILVNTAGIIQQTNLIDGDTEKWRKILETNVLGLCIATREAVKIMKANKIDGHIVHICSITGHYVPNVPGWNVYPASKYAIRALTETLRQEFNQEGLKIKVTEISPGLVATEIMQNNSFQLDLKDVTDGPSLNSEDIADAILYVLSTPPHVQVHELIVRPLGETY